MMMMIIIIIRHDNVIKEIFFLSLFSSVGYNRLASSQQKCE